MDNNLLSEHYYRRGLLLVSGEFEPRDDKEKNSTTHNTNCSRITTPHYYSVSLSESERPLLALERRRKVSDIWWRVGGMGS
jgi:hypothetical protein